MSAPVSDRVALVVPTLNEAAHIEACLASLLPQAEAMGALVVVADGGSTDPTVTIVAALAQHHPCLSVLHNPKRLQSAAINLAAHTLPAEITVLVRADAHALYPPDFVARCVTELRARDATSVVVPMRTVGRGGMQRAIAAVQNGRIGNGGSAHRTGLHSGFVDHGHHAAFDRRFFLRLGGYDESFSHNEDAELDVRALRAGGRIWMCREAAITYFPRRRLGPLATQYFRHGRGRARTLLRHRIRPRPRQMAAPAILVGTLLAALSLPFTPWPSLLLLAYALACASCAVVSALRARDPWLLAMAPAAMVVHLSWAAGFLRTIMAAPLPAPAATRTAPALSP